MLALRFALVNHRLAECGGRRVVRQAVMFFGCVLVIQFIFTSLSALEAAGFYRITQEQRKVSSESMVRRARWEARARRVDERL